jgi:hypothetical protein
LAIARPFFFGPHGPHLQPMRPAPGI